MRLELEAGNHSYGQTGTGAIPQIDRAYSGVPDGNPQADLLLGEGTLPFCSRCRRLRIRLQSNTDRAAQSRARLAFDPKRTIGSEEVRAKPESAV